MASKRSDNTVRMEQWNIADPKADKTLHPSGRRMATKIAVRNSLGQFNGATNYRGSLRG